MKQAVLFTFFCIVAALSAAPANASGAIQHGGTYFGTDWVVAPDEVVDGNINVVFGNLDIYGTVKGDVTTVGGSVRQHPGSVVTGSVNGAIDSDTVSSIAPWLPQSGVAAMLAQNNRVLTRLMYSAVVLLFFLIFPFRVRLALERVEKHPGLSAVVGTIAMVAIIPLALLLLVSIIGIPLIPLEIAALFAGVFIGQAALALLIGRRLYEAIRPHTTPSPIAALVLGLVLLSAAEIVPLVGAAVTALVWLVGLGATILAFMREPGMRAPIGGVPMNPA